MLGVERVSLLTLRTNMDFTTLHSFSLELEKIAETKRERELFKRVKKESPVKVRITDTAKLFGGGYFDPAGEGHVGISDRHFDVIAHEIGHAQNHQKLWGKLIHSVPSMLAFKVAPIAGAFAGAALAKGKKWPLLVPAAAVTPILLAEALASNTGRKVLEKVKAKSEEVEKYRKNMRSAFSTYLDTPIASAATAGAFYYLLRNVKKV